MNLQQRQKGAGKGPQKLLAHGLAKQIESIGHSIVKHVNCKSELMLQDDFMGIIRNPRATGAFCKQLNEAVSNNNDFPLVLGGDHSIAIGSISAMLEKHPNLLVIWVDAHADINTPSSTSSGNLHGCPVSFLMGMEGTSNMIGFEWNAERKNFLKAQNLVYIGLRDLDEPEKKIIESLKIKAYSMRNVEEMGISRIMKEILESSTDQPIHLSFDVDGLDPIHTASTGTPVEGGLTLREGRYICETIWDSQRLVSMDVVEVNPELGDSKDVSNTLESTCLLIQAALGRSLL